VLRWLQLWKLLLGDTQLGSSSLGQMISQPRRRAATGSR
jgi:hypothetical protein